MGRVGSIMETNQVTVEKYIVLCLIYNMSRASYYKLERYKARGTLSLSCPNSFPNSFTRILSPFIFNTIKDQIVTAGGKFNGLFVDSRERVENGARTVDEWMERYYD